MTDESSYITLKMFCALLKLSSTRGQQLVYKNIIKIFEEDKFLSYRGEPMPMPVFPRKGTEWKFDCLEVERYLNALNEFGENPLGKRNTIRWREFDDTYFIPESIKKMRAALKTTNIYEQDKIRERKDRYNKLRYSIMKWHRNTQREAEARGMTLEEYCNLPEHNFEIEKVKI